MVLGERQRDERGPARSAAPGSRARSSRCQPYDITVLAEKLETQEDYTYCAQLGCDLFQGYFFCRPQLVRGPRLDANRLSLLALLAALQDPAAQLADLEGMIARDLRVSYRLLSYINSAFFALRQPVRSIGQALALLGLENLQTLGGVGRVCLHRRQTGRADGHGADSRAVLRARRPISARQRPG